MKEFELEPGEHVVLQVRKHWFLFFIELLPYAILAVIPFALPKLLPLVPPLAPYAESFAFSTPVARALLGIGNIKAQTAAEDVEFVMHGIPRPEMMRDLILKYVPEEDQKTAGV